jgi:predicted nucleotidyltransferase
METLLSEVAKDFVRLKLARADGVSGVLLVGSQSVGYAEGCSDIDLEVFVTKESFSKMRREREAYESYRGTDISWEWMTLQELEGTLRLEE